MARCTGFIYWTVLVVSIIGLPTNAHGGVISDLPEDQVEQVLALYHRSCGGGGGGYGGYGPSSSEPNVNIVCKEPREYVSPQDKKVIKIPAQMSAYKKQVIFVEVPATHFKHEITLVPGPQDERSPTKIYVLPQKSSHDIRVEDQTYGAGGVSKPEVFFLKGGNNLDIGGGTGGGYGVPPDGYGPPATQAPPSVSYGVTPVQPPSTTYGVTPEQPPSQSYGQPPVTLPTYGPPESAPPSSGYGSPQASPPSSSYGSPPPPAAATYGPPSTSQPSGNYGPPSASQSSGNYGPPSTSQPSGNYGPPSGSTEQEQTQTYVPYTVPPGYVVKQTYEVQSNKLTYSTLPPQLRTNTQSPSSTTRQITQDASLSSLLRKLSDRLRSNSRRHARYHSTYNILSSSTRNPSTTTNYSQKQTERPRFIFPSESRVVPVKAILGASTRVASIPSVNKFSSKFNSYKNVTSTAPPPELIEITQEDAITTAETPKYGSRIVLPTPSTPSHEEKRDGVEQQSYSNKDSEGTIFEYVPATYLGYTYVVDGINSTNAPAPQQQQLEQYTS